MRPHEKRPFVEVMRDPVSTGGFNAMGEVFLTDRDARFRKMTDETWGEDNWVRCRQGCLDTLGYPAYHHKDYHA